MELERELKSAYAEFELWKGLLVQANANILSRSHYNPDMEMCREEKLVDFISLKAGDAFGKCLDIVEQIRNEEVPVETVERIVSGN